MPPKKTYKITRFDGGVNENSSAKDIVDNESTVLENLSVAKVGQLFCHGELTKEEAGKGGTGGTRAAFLGTAVFGGPGTGLFILNVDNNKFQTGLSSGSEIGNDSGSGAPAAGSTVYYIMQDSTGWSIIDTVTAGGGDEQQWSGAETNSNRADIFYFLKGALRWIDTNHDKKSFWRGLIPGKLYGNNENSGDNQWFHGYIHNSGENKVTQWTTNEMNIKGCFPEEQIPGGSHSNNVYCGKNLIMWRKDMFQGLLNAADVNTYAEPNPGPGFANEKCAIGTGVAAPGNLTTSSGMFWGFSLGYHEFKNESGGWAPTGSENYQFYCTTIYDGIQESLPQLFQMYPSGVQFDGTYNDSRYHDNMTLQNQLPKTFLSFGNGENPSDDTYSTWPKCDERGERIKMLFDPIIKWNGLEHPASAAGDYYTNTFAARDPKFNFGAENVGDTADGNPRITGLKVYWASDEDGFVDLWQLFEWDFEKGVKAIGSDTGGGGYNKVDYTHLGPGGKIAAGVTSQWPVNGSGYPKYPYHYQHTHGRPNDGYGLEFHSPPRFLRYDAVNGHTKDETIELDSFKTACVANGRVYAGNVKYDGVVYEDKMIRSGYCLTGSTPDKFPIKSGSLDVATEDGDAIVLLLEFADRIFQFKKNVLYIINVSGSSEFIERKYDYRGIPNAACAVATDFGIAWVNRQGAFLHDGTRITNLLEPKAIRLIKATTWETFAGFAGDTNADTDHLRIGFDALRREIIVKDGHTDSKDAYIYNMTTQSWTLSKDYVYDADSLSPFIPDRNTGKIFQLALGPDSKWQILSAQESTVDQNIKLTTKDMDFGEPGIQKTVKKVYITYKGGKTATIKYSINGDTSSLKEFSASAPSTQTLAYTTDAFTVKTFIPNVAAEAKNIYSFQIHIDGEVKDHFAINDISIVYKMSRVK